ncbi:MAG TPA: SDR family oxidoreductase [Cyclobacteriaceae bacterium]|nr:SDR family oxidoreductase [Cyclobacteriaceae bacterium]
MSKLKDSIIWITGASSGIGEALSYELSKAGAKLILSARRKEELERVKGNCDAAAQQHIKILPLDLTQTDTLALATEAAIQFFGHIDILINNGGISQRGLAKDTLLKVDRQIMEVNFFGTLALTKALLPHFMQRKQGHFVVVTSVTGIVGTPYRSAYAASKHALHGFFDSLRAEHWKDNIHVSLICPGFIHTPITYAALTGDGTPLNKMDEAQFKGKSPVWLAKKIHKAIVAQKEEVYLGGTKEVSAVYVKRFFPSLFSKILRKAKVR